MTSRPVPRNTSRVGCRAAPLDGDRDADRALAIARRIERQIRLAADGRQVGLAPSLRAGLDQRGDDEHRARGVSIGATSRVRGQ